MILVKAGGSAVTDKKKEFTPRMDVIEKVADQLSRSGKQIILIHGGGSFGHPLAKKFGLQHGFTEKSQIEGVSRTRYSMTELNQLIVSTFIKKGIHAVSVQTSACFVCEDARISLSFLEPVERFLKLGCVPVLYGDVVTDTKMGFCILSGDQIVSYLARKFNPERVIFGLEVDGLYTKDPQYRDAELIREVTFSDLKSVGGGETGDVTKGMKGKLSEIENMRGVEVDLINLTKEGTLLKALKGDITGTRIR